MFPCTPSRLALAALAAAFLLLAACAAPNAAPQAGTALFPEPVIDESGMLEVSELHAVHYEVSGTPDGIPVMVLHGGPGAGGYPRLHRYFDPAVFRIVVHSQRGAGASTPAGELRENTTQDLVSDIERLREHLGIERMMVFGGSWGTTLALAYAEAHPERVTGMVFRGVFLASDDDLDFHYRIAPQRFAPREYTALLAALPAPDERPLLERLDAVVNGDDAALRQRVLIALGHLEMRMSSLVVPDARLQMVDEYLTGDKGEHFYGIDQHYLSNHYFLEEGQLLRDVERIAEIPIIIVHGRYDLLAPLSSAYALEQAHPRTKLVIVEGAGHSEAEPAVTAALVEAVEEMGRQLGGP